MLCMCLLSISFLQSRGTRGPHSKPWSTKTLECGCDPYHPFLQSVLMNRVATVCTSVIELIFLSIDALKLSSMRPARANTSVCVKVCECVSVCEHVCHVTAKDG